LVVIVNGAEKQIEWLIYESSQNDKFMRVVERIYENRHIGFETGYKKLRDKS